MRRYIIFTLVLLTKVLFAQIETYHQFPDSNALWNIVREDYGWPVNSKEHYSIEIIGDTIINGSLYQKLFTPYIQPFDQSSVALGYNGAIREDTINKPAHNELAAEQCGRFPEASIHQTCKR